MFSPKVLKHTGSWSLDFESQFNWLWSGPAFNIWLQLRGPLSYPSNGFHSLKKQSLREQLRPHICPWACGEKDLLSFFESLVDVKRLLDAILKVWLMNKRLQSNTFRKHQHVIRNKGFLQANDAKLIKLRFSYYIDGNYKISR